jgi:NAD(P)H-dependent flavin oxidoreductase YrpB (nitropropane dioxygenase family)
MEKVRTDVMGAASGGSMRKNRRCVAALALFAALLVNGSAFAATRDARPTDWKAKIKGVIVTILEDIKGGLPPG